MNFKSLISALLSVSLIAPPVYADSYIFRYKSGNINYSTIDPESPVNESDYDITASFIAFIGEQSSFQIPLKPGKTANSWIVKSGGEPRGLKLNSDSGIIEGTAIGRGKSTMSLIGVSSNGGDVSKVNVDITVLERDPTSKEVTVYAHSDRFFEQAIATPGEAYSWEPIIPLPSWARMSGMNIIGTPPEGLEGVFSFAMQGKDFTGVNSKLVYGKLVVNVGPVISFIDDLFVEPNKYLSLSASATNTVGKLKWKIEGDSLPANLGFSSEDGRITGSVSTFDTSARIRMIGFDTDGTVGYSNYFMINSRSPDLDINNIQDRNLFVGTFNTMNLYAKEIDATPTWKIEKGELPEGMTIDAASGTISGTPTKAEVKERIVLNVSTSRGYSASSNEFKMVVHEKPLKVAAIAHTHVRIGKSFSTPMPVISDGRAPYEFTLAEGQTALDGVVLNEMTGVISGTYAIAGAKNIALQVKDANGTISTPFVVGVSAYNPLSISIEPASVELTRLTTDAIIVPKYEKNTLIPNEKASLGDFRLTGSLPEGLLFNSNTGTITGKAKINGYYGPLSMQVTDGAGDRATSNSFSIRVLEKEPLSVEVLRDSFAAFGTYASPFVRAVNPAGKATYALKSGVLPTGLSLSPDGAIIGKPTVEGRSSDIVITVTDDEGAVAETKPFDVTVTPPEDMEIVSKDIRWSVYRPLNIVLEAKNFSQSVSFAVTSGSLPAGVTLSPDGKFSGQASDPSEVTVAITATDNLNRTATKTLKLTFTAAMTLKLNGSYELPRLAATIIEPETTNAIGSVSFSITGTLPDGLMFNPTSGTISGKPSKVGETQNITVAVVDSAGTRATATTKLTITERQPLKLAYNFTNPLTENSASGLPKRPLEPTYAVGEVAYSVAGVLPDGLTFNAKDGSFGGTPLKVGVFEGIVVAGRDTDGTTASSEPLRIVVAPNQQFSVANLAVSGRVGTLMQTEAPQVKGAVGTVTYSTTTPTPLGLTFSTTYGVFTGVPSSTGGQVVTVGATDSVGRKTTFQITLKVVDELMVTYDNTSANQHAPIRIQPVVENAIDEVTFTVANGSIGNLTLNSKTGEITGAPSAIGTLTFSIRAIDEGTSNNTYTTGNITITVGQRLPLEIAMAEDQNLLVNQKFSQKATVKNAVGEVTWTITSGDIPTGLSLSDGIVSGLPTQLGFFTATFRATDSVGGSASQTVNYVVTTNGLPISLTTYSVQTKSGLAFLSQLPLVKNAVGDYSFYSDDLASHGIKLDPVTGEISGKFDSPVRVTGNIHVTDSTNRVTSKPITIEVIPNLMLSMRETSNVTASTEMSALRPSVEYAIGTVRYELLGPTLPTGLTFNKSNGAISGTPTVLGNFKGYFIEGVDGLGDRATSNEFSVVVHPSGILPSVTTNALYRWQASSGIVTITPTVSPKKLGDVYTLNKALPGTLSINETTGVISGIVSISNVGKYTGYVITLTDTAENRSDSNEFDIQIYSNPPPLYNVQSFDVRRGVPFVSKPAVLMQGVPAGKTKFLDSYLPKFLSIDPETGTISGTIPITQTGTSLVYSIYTDDQDQIFSHSRAYINLVKLGIDYKTTSYSVDAGQPFTSAEPEISNNVGPVQFSWKPGSEVDGLSVDPVTGVISGTPFVGNYRNRVVVARDDVEATEIAISIDAKNPTAIYSFADEEILAADLSTLYTTNPVHVTGIVAPAVLTISGADYAYRICSASNCSDGNWSATTSSVTNTTILPNSYLQLRRTTSSTFSLKAYTTVNIGGKSSQWAITNRGYSNTITEVDFGPEAVDVERSEAVLSKTVQLTGFSDVTEVRLKPVGVSTKREYLICTTFSDCENGIGDWKNWSTSSSMNFNVNPNEYLRLRLTVSNSVSTSIEVIAYWAAKPTNSLTQFGSFKATSRGFSNDIATVILGGDKRGVDPTVGADYSYHFSNIVQLRGFSDPTMLRMQTNYTSTTAFHYRTCIDADCDAVIRDWKFISDGRSNFSDIQVQPNQYLQLRIAASNSHSTEGSIKLLVPALNNKELGSFLIETRSLSNVPNTLNFGPAQENMDYGANVWIETAPVELTGYVDPVAITFKKPAKVTSSVVQYKRCPTSDCSSVTWKDIGWSTSQHTSTEAAVVPGTFVQLRARLIAANDTRTITVSAPSGDLGAFTVTARPLMDIPDAVYFGTIVGAEVTPPVDPVYSNVVRVNGTRDDAPVTFTQDRKGTAALTKFRICDNATCDGVAWKEIGWSTSQFSVNATLKPAQYVQVQITPHVAGQTREITISDKNKNIFGRFIVTAK